MSLLPGRLRSEVAMSRLGFERIDSVLLDVERAAGTRTPDLRDLWESLSPERSLVVLSALIKADLRGRFARGDNPQVAAYLEQFSVLKTSSERVVSLVYEEFCLLRECGEAADPEEFCVRYDAWRDSLMAQLECHELLSQAAGIKPSIDRLPAPGDRFRSFRLRELLGQGGSARVFLAHDESLGNRPVALKVSTDRGTEAWIQGQLDHDHIVPVLSVIDDTESGLRALCMPYRAGLTLDEVIVRVNPLSRPSRASALREAIAGCSVNDEDKDRQANGWQGFPTKGTYAEGVAWIGSVVADALGYAHQRNILHRDVKPANVLLTVRDGPLLLDFNLAQAPHSADSAQSALRGGTLPYMAPEQLEAFLDASRWNDVNEAAEVYSLGLLLRELLTGRRPDAPDPKLPLTRAIRDLLDHRMADVPVAVETDPAVPGPLQAILNRCLAPRPQDRYPTATALADDLRRFVNKRRLRNRVGLAIAATAMITLFAVAGTQILTPNPIQQSKNLTQDVRSRLNKSGQTPLSAEELAACRIDIDRALKADPSSVEALYLSSILHGKNADWDPALQDIRTAIQLAHAKDSGDSDDDKLDAIDSLHLHEGTALMNLNLFEDAARVYRGVTSTAKAYPQGYGYLADAIQGMIPTVKDMDELERLINEEIEALTQALNRGEFSEPPVGKDGLSKYRYMRALAQHTRGTVIQARAYWIEDKHRQSQQFLLAEADYMGAESDLEAADEMLKKWLASKRQTRDPDQHRDWLVLAGNVKLGLGDVASQREDYANAIRYFQASLRLIDQAIALGNAKPATTELRNVVASRLETDLPNLKGDSGALNDPN